MALSRGEKKLGAVCALAFLMLASVAVFYGHINKTPIIAAAPIPKPPQTNGYDLYVQASNAIKPANPPVDPNLEIKTITDPKIRAQRYSLKRKDAWLAQNKAGFALFERAQKADSLAPSVEGAGRNSLDSAIRRMARYKVAESNAHWMRGDHNAALESGLDIVQLGYDIQRGAGWMGFNTGHIFNGKSRTTTSDTIEHLSANQARVAARRLEKLLSTRWTLKQALIEDRRRMRQRWLTNFKKPDWRTETLAYRIHPAFNTPLSLRERWRSQTISKRQIMADIDSLYQPILPAAHLPYGIKGSPPIALDDPFLEFDQVLLQGVRYNQAHALAADSELMLRLALRAHQLEQGAPPPMLQALVPAYIQAVPADPFGKGEPLRYKTNGQSYTLWSIGPDGKDDGGKPFFWWNKAPKRYADEREKLPPLGNTTGDYVAGKNQ